MDLLTPKDVAQLLGVSEQWVRLHANGAAPQLPHLRLGRFLRFRRVDIEAWVERMVETE